MSQDPSPTTIVRSDIWYTDGTVVLQAQATQFRVYWGVLAQQSSFFRAMQALPQPPNQPNVDGCPIIQLHDNVADVECLLKALFTPTVHAHSALPLSMIAALIRLGRKYDFHELLELAVARLTYENPSTLEEYEARMAAHAGKAYRATRIQHYPGILIDILTLARENDLQSVLPCAYYRVVLHHKPKQLFDGVPRGDGTTAMLAPVDQRQCIISRDELIKARFREGYTLGWLQKWPYDSDCLNPAICNRGRFDRTHFYVQCDPLWILGRSTQDKEVLCPACYRYSNQLTTAGRKKFWEELPKFFDLPPWSELGNDL
ncbi:BTB domain-containing protein [Mycena sanguinolenta]|uniref:BTB domain-containing protein n=1 Tax=Mycena sanguinolenta TaxID=230812 RepID=A0A8H6Y1G4_9AGAR|nr:BTB domain-containing protein [Mycena sanguinolenta]